MIINYLTSTTKMICRVSDVKMPEAWWVRASSLQQVSEDDGGNGLDDDGGAEGEADIVATGDV